MIQFNKKKNKLKIKTFQFLLKQTNKTLRSDFVPIIYDWVDIWIS